MSTTLSEFLRATIDGAPAVAVTAAPVILPRDIEHGVLVRHLDGATMRTRDGLLREYAEAWNFPDYFWLSWASFDDCFGDLDGQVPPQQTATGSAPGGVLTVVDHAEQFLADADADDLAYFAQQQSVYRDLYRTPNAYGADRPHPLAFGLILHTDARHLKSLRRRWVAVGAESVILVPDEKD
ncbi:MAG: barstar family protein [Gordonia sp. (in: high G+C Gram-positive bacteria)]|uniref:barstar family protein n=1 Tax=Gordonia sp. (in: high G+C Gram-positive bacteria) TaxID=84139 RepID=UPI003BB50139